MKPADDAHDEESQALYLLLAALCNRLHVDVVLPTLGTLLVEVVVASCKTFEGVESFSELFTDELRDRWIKAHSIENTSEKVN